MKININIKLTFSKIIALLLLVFAFVLELKYEINGNIFIVAVPAIVVLITGKQIVDGQVEKKKEENGDKNQNCNFFIKKTYHRV
jgi:general stress protein CsbA